MIMTLITIVIFGEGRRTECTSWMPVKATL
jgi:hypothetical protein